MKDDPLTECEECGAPARRLIGPGAGFLFKGDGFYITDYRSQEYKEKAKSEKPGDKPAADGAKSAEKKSGGDAKSPSSAKKAPDKGGSSKK